jgi:hypothetical protein
VEVKAVQITAHIQTVAMAAQEVALGMQEPLEPEHLAKGLQVVQVLAVVLAAVAVVVLVLSAQTPPHLVRPAMAVLALAHLSLVSVCFMLVVAVAVGVQ